MNSPDAEKNKLFFLKINIGFCDKYFFRRLARRRKKDFRKMMYLWRMMSYSITGLYAHI